MSLSSWNRLRRSLRVCFCRASFSSGNKRSVPSFSDGVVPDQDLPLNLSFTAIGTIKVFFLPVEHFVSHLKRLEAHSQIMRKMPSDVQRTGTLRSVFRQPLDLNRSQCLICLIDRQLCRSLKI